MESKYKVKFRTSTDVDGERILASLILHLSLPLLLLKIIEFTGWKDFLKASTKVMLARKWAREIDELHGVELHPELDLAAQERNEYLEWVPDGPGKETE